jgi:hypothetical protein
MYRMELALIIVMGVNDLHARFIRLFYFCVWNYSVKPNEHWTSLLGQGHGEE